MAEDINGAEIWKIRATGGDVYVAAEWHGSGGELAGPYLVGPWRLTREEAAADVAAYRGGNQASDGWHSRVRVLAHSTYAGRE